MGRLAILILTWLLGPGCAGPGIAVTEKLARVGLERVSVGEAALPPGERHRFLPVRVIPGAAGALPDHPAGYLIVGVGSSEASDASEILEALEAWHPGEDLRLRVRRNPYLQPENEWWEGEVRLPW